MEPHPLATWLDAKNLKPYQFAQKIGVGPHTIYRLLSGDRINPRLDTKVRIEQGTGGAVTSAMIDAWALKFQGASQPQ